MTDSDPISEGLRARLAEELDEVPLATPHPAGARYQRLGPGANGGWRRLATAAVLATVAALVLGAGATAAVGPPRVLHWLQADRLPFTTPAATPSPEPSEAPSTAPAVAPARATEEPAPVRGEPTEKPEAGDSKAAPSRPEADHDAGERPKPQPTSTAEREGGQAPPAASPSPADGESGH